ncbi:hypothetical protein HKX48_006974, partial [Thoreauomyces humboldtii]
GGVDLQSALQNALKGKTLRATAPSPAAAAAPVELSMQEQLMAAVRNRSTVRKPPSDIPAPSPKQAEPEPASMQDQLRMTLQRRANRPAIGDLESPKQKSEPVIDFQSQLRGALKSRPPGGAVLDLEKKADSGNTDPTPLRASGTVRDKWKSLEKSGSSGVFPAVVTSPTRKLGAVTPTAPVTPATPAAATLTPTPSSITIITPITPETETVKHTSEVSEATQTPGPAAEVHITPRSKAASEVKLNKPVDEEPEAAMPAAPMLPPAPGIPPGTIVTALADYEATGESQLSFLAGETFKVVKWEYGNGWAYGESADGVRAGVFPQTYVSIGG